MLDQNTAHFLADPKRVGEFSRALLDEVLEAFETTYPVIRWLLGVTEPLKS